MERTEGKASVLQTPLIQNPEKMNTYESVAGSEKIVEELVKQLFLAAPMILVSLLQFSLQLISVGRINTFWCFFGHLICICYWLQLVGTYKIGIGSALETLCGHLYGAKQYHMLGIHMQTAMFVVLLVSIPLAIIWANTGSVLMALGQDPEITRLAGSYARFMIPSFLGFGLLQCQVRFLQTQSIVLPMLISSGIISLSHVLLCWMLVFKSGLGFRGAALANSISYWLNVFLLGFFIKFSSSCKRTWKGFSKEALNEILTFLRLSIPSALMVCLEDWSFEMMVLLSGLLPNPELETSVLSISLNLATTIWMIPFGLSCAVARGSRTNWGQDIHRLHGWQSACNEAEVIKSVALMMPILAASNFMDGLQCVLSGAVRGLGWQKIGAYVNLGSYYLVRIPIAILLAFIFHTGGKGLWLGIMCVLLVQVVCLFVITLHTDWEIEAKKAKDRVYDTTLPVEILS